MVPVSLILCLFVGTHGGVSSSSSVVEMFVLIPIKLSRCLYSCARDLCIDATSSVVKMLVLIPIKLSRCLYSQQPDVCIDSTSIEAAAGMMFVAGVMYDACIHSMMTQERGY